MFLIIDVLFQPEVALVVMGTGFLRMALWSVLEMLARRPKLCCPKPGRRTRTKATPEPRTPELATTAKAMIVKALRCVLERRFCVIHLIENAGLVI
jgi:hypothetical protein